MNELADDILEGAAAVAHFLFGPDAHPRRALTAFDQGLPHYKLGNRFYARKSTILEWISAQEAKSRSR